METLIGLVLVLRVTELYARSKVVIVMLYFKSPIDGRISLHVSPTGIPPDPPRHTVLIPYIRYLYFTH